MLISTVQSITGKESKEDQKKNFKKPGNISSRNLQVILFEKEPKQLFFSILTSDNGAVRKYWDTKPLILELSFDPDIRQVLKLSPKKNQKKLKKSNRNVHTGLVKEK